MAPWGEMQDNKLRWLYNHPRFVFGGLGTNYRVNLYQHYSLLTQHLRMQAGSVSPSTLSSATAQAQAIASAGGGTGRPFSAYCRPFYGAHTGAGLLALPSADSCKVSFQAMLPTLWQLPPPRLKLQQAAEAPKG